MQSRTLSRRWMLSALGAGAALAPATARAWLGAPAGVTSDDAGAKRTVGGETAAVPELLAPLAVGARVAGCTIASIGALEAGAVSLVLQDRDGQSFGVEVCARGDEGHAGPGRTAYFDVFVVNEGDGATPTFESHGLAAMAVADVLRVNEERVGNGGFLTLDERLHQHAASVMRPA